METIAYLCVGYIVGSHLTALALYLMAFYLLRMMKAQATAENKYSEDQLLKMAAAVVWIFYRVLAYWLKKANIAIELPHFALPDPGIIDANFSERE